MALKRWRWVAPKYPTVAKSLDISFYGTLTLVTDITCDMLACDILRINILSVTEAQVIFQSVFATMARMHKPVRYLLLVLGFPESVTMR